MCVYSIFYTLVLNFQLRCFSCGILFCAYLADLLVTLGSISEVGRFQKLGCYIHHLGWVGEKEMILSGILKWPPNLGVMCTL